MTKDLNMTGTQYNTAVTLFFVPYTLLEVPSNIVLKMMRPSYWMAILMFCWGLVMTLMGLTSSYGGLLAGRFFLGVTEVCVRKQITTLFQPSILTLPSLVWLLPSCNFLAHALVPSFRAPASHGCFLCSCFSRRRLQWSPRLRNRETRWSCRTRRMAGKQTDLALLYNMFVFGLTQK